MRQTVRQAFSAQVKEELARLWPTERCCQEAELAALLRAGGSVQLNSGRVGLLFSTEQAAAARKVISLLKALTALRCEVMVKRRAQLRKNLTYLVQIQPQPGSAEFFERLGLVSDLALDPGQLPDHLLADDCCRRAYLRGLFLAGGWVSSPERGYHLELTALRTETADALGQLIFSYGVPIRLSYRKEFLVLYLKDGEQIANFLSLMGAHQARLHYEDVRAFKEMKNVVQRQVNAETANLSKTVEAAGRQLEAIKALKASGRLEGLPEPLVEMAELRLAHPEASLKELGELCRPPVGKSGANHRMRQLLLAAESN